MKLYCNLKLKGIENESDFNSRFTGINKIVNLVNESGQAVHFNIDECAANEA